MNNELLKVDIIILTIIWQGKGKYRYVDMFMGASHMKVVNKVSPIILPLHCLSRYVD